MKKISKLTSLVVLLLVFFSCKKNDDDVNAGDFPGGIITGKVVANNNRTPIRQALVFVSTNGKVYHTNTNSNGEFSFKVPAGHHDLHIQTGDGSLFRTIIPVDVVLDQTIAVSSSAVKLQQVADLAYVTGAFDRIEEILIDSMGYIATELNNNDLDDIGNLIPYDAIFLDCGGPVYGDSSHDAVFSQYVSNGGSLYLSDWSVDALIGNFDFSTGQQCGSPRAGGFIQDNLLCADKSGVHNTAYPNSRISSPALQSFLGKTTMDVIYDLGDWEHIRNVDTNFWEVLVKHPTADSAFAIRTHQYHDPSAPALHVGSANDTAWVTICHIEENGSITITIPASELSGHLAHGDHVGTCDNPTGSGWIYYTTFHNHANGLLGSDIRGMLEFMILNL